MGAGCSRRTRGHLRTASGQERLRPRLSVAERWALLIRKARGLQILTARVVYRRWDETPRAADAGMITDTLGTFIDDGESFAGDSECMDTWYLVPPQHPRCRDERICMLSRPQFIRHGLGPRREGNGGVPLHARPSQELRSATHKRTSRQFTNPARACTASGRDLHGDRQTAGY